MWKEAYTRGLYCVYACHSATARVHGDGSRARHLDVVYNSGIWGRQEQHVAPFSLELCVARASMAPAAPHGKPRCWVSEGV